MPSGLLAFANEFSATCVRLFAYAGGLAFVVAAGAKIGAPAVEAAIAPSPRPQWSDVERPLRAFTASLPEFGDAEPAYAIRRNRKGDGRKDIMIWGPAWNDPTGAGSRLMIEIYRPGQEFTRFDDVASEAAARTRDLGGPYRLAPADAINSKFGRIATFTFTADKGVRPRACLGFARTFQQPLFEIAGWYCKANAEVVDAAMPACALERLSLLMAASEPKITQLFARAELRRTTCDAKAARMSNTNRRDWISARKAPMLRGRVAAR